MSKEIDPDDYDPYDYAICIDGKYGTWMCRNCDKCKPVIQEMQDRIKKIQKEGKACECEMICLPDECGCCGLCCKGTASMDLAICEECAIENGCCDYCLKPREYKQEEKKE